MGGRGNALRQKVQSCPKFRAGDLGHHTSAHFLLSTCFPSLGPQGYKTIGKESFFGLFPSDLPSQSGFGLGFGRASDCLMQMGIPNKGSIDFDSLLQHRSSGEQIQEVLRVGVGTREEYKVIRGEKSVWGKHLQASCPPLAPSPGRKQGLQFLRGCSQSQLCFAEPQFMSPPTTRILASFSSLTH